MHLQGYGMYYFSVSFTDVAEEALHRSVVDGGEINYHNTTILLLNEIDEDEDEVGM